MGSNDSGDDLKPGGHGLERKIECRRTKEETLLKKSIKTEVEDEDGHKMPYHTNSSYQYQIGLVDKPGSTVNGKIRPTKPKTSHNCPCCSSYYDSLELRYAIILGQFSIYAPVPRHQYTLAQSFIAVTYSYLTSVSALAPESSASTR